MQIEQHLLFLINREWTNPAMDWLMAIEERREPTCSGANGAKAVEMVMAVYQAHLSGRRVNLPLANRKHPLG